MRVRRILVPVDFSPRSRRALDYALEVAAGSGADLEVLHVVRGPSQTQSAIDGYLGRPLPHAAPEALAEARVALERFVAAAGPAVTPRLLVDAGDTAAVIVRTAVQRASDLVVIGTRGHRGVAEVLRGSVAHKVITCAPCPVTTLRG